jgi:flagellar biosynthesis protein FliQ
MSTSVETRAPFATIEEAIEDIRQGKVVVVVDAAARENEGALTIAAKLAAPILLMALGVGVVVSIMQTITQIQEQTLSFVPKLAGVALIIVVAGSWMIRELVTWVTRLWSAIPTLTPGKCPAACKESRL